jgi:hypothetical protein
MVESIRPAISVTLAMPIRNERKGGSNDDTDGNADLPYLSEGIYSPETLGQILL